MTGWAALGLVAITACAPAAETQPPTPGAESTVRRPNFKSCYSAGLALNPDLAGTITLLIHVDASGAVESVTKSSGSGLTPDVEECLMAKVRTERFNPPGGNGVSLSVPVTFIRAEKAANP